MKSKKWPKATRGWGFRSGIDDSVVWGGCKTRHGVLGYGEFHTVLISAAEYRALRAAYRKQEEGNG